MLILPLLHRDRDTRVRPNSSVQLGWLKPLRPRSPLRCAQPAWASQVMFFFLFFWCLICCLMDHSSICSPLPGCTTSSRLYGCRSRVNTFSRVLQLPFLWQDTWMLYFGPVFHGDITTLSHQPSTVSGMSTSLSSLAHALSILSHCCGRVMHSLHNALQLYVGQKNQPIC